MPKKRRSKRLGAVMALTLPLLLLLLFVAAGLIRALLGRHLTAARVTSSLKNRHLAESVRRIVDACLQDSTFAAAGACVPTAAQQSCFPSTIEGKAVGLSWSGAPPQCQVSVSIDE